VAAASSGCGATPTAIFRPESPGAGAIYNLSIYLLVVAGAVFLLVETILLLAVFRFRGRPEEQATQTHGNIKLETGWTVATAVVLFVTLGLTVRTMGEASSLPEAALPQSSAWPGDTLVLRVVGAQWWWKFEYPDLKIVTANEVHVPEGRPIKLQLESADVIHSFWVPQLGGKTDMIPGHINYSSFLATSTGVYDGECAEFCGAEHARMGFRVFSDSPAEFSAWVKTQQSPAAQPITDDQKAGRDAFQRSCAACHTVAGTTAAGTVGPDLTHFGSRSSLAANTLPNTADNLAKWLQDPQTVKPGNNMPNLKLDQATVGHLVAYLESLK
jgi:cytochrome c oxidase subunit 2